MAFDEGLAERIRALGGPDPLVSERKMFGGLCFMSSGNMSFGIVGTDLMVRVGPDARVPLSKASPVLGRPAHGLMTVVQGCSPLVYDPDEVLCSSEAVRDIAFLVRLAHPYNDAPILGRGREAIGLGRIILNR